MQVRDETITYHPPQKEKFTKKTEFFKQGDCIVLNQISDSEGHMICWAERSQLRDATKQCIDIFIRWKSKGEFAYIQGDALFATGWKTLVDYEYEIVLK